MKPFLIAILLLLLIPIVAVRAEKLAACTPKRNLESMAYWRPDSIVNVYFFRSMFTSEQRQALLDAMESWEETAKKFGSAVSFSYAGETDGLIDCQNCLTVARQDVYTIDRKGHTSFNALRRNDMGQLISAWIGIDGATNDSAGLRGLMPGSAARW